MNLKTTLLLVILGVAGGLGWFFYATFKPEEVSSPTLSFLEKDLRPDKLARIEITRDDRRVVLERQAGEWSLAGKWPVRQTEVQQFVDTLTNLRSRFAPVTLAESTDLKKFGLHKDPLRIDVKLSDGEHTLLLGEDPADSNQFARPTYLRVGKRQAKDSVTYLSEVVRLAPGLVAALDRPVEYFKQRRIFEAVRVPKEEGATEKIDQVKAKYITIKTRDSTSKTIETKYSLKKTGTEWEIDEPARDRPDPDKLRTLLTALTDIWAEQFAVLTTPELVSTVGLLASPAAGALQGLPLLISKDFGLHQPEQTLTVTPPSGGETILLVGKKSGTKERQVSKPGPFGPAKPMVFTIDDEYRFAKLQGNEQVFEIKAENLKDILVSADTLRDPQLARFKADDVRRLEIKHGEVHLALVKEKDKWRVQKPKDLEAEASQVTEVLDKLSGLQARDKDIIDKGDPKSYGLDKPVLVHITVEEKPKASKAPDEAAPAKTRHFTFHLGTTEKEKGKLFVMIEGWPRINSVEDAVLKLIKRPAIAYRSRRVLDVAGGDLSRVEIQREAESYVLEQVKNSWRLAEPVQADIDAGKADSLAGDLSRLEAVEFVTEDPKAEDLEKLYGLSKPAVTAKLVFGDPKKAPQTIAVGKQREGKDEYFARLGNDPAVFVIRKSVFEALNKDSLALRPLQLWNVPEDDIAELRIHKDDPEYRLKREGEKWKITAPFEATAAADQVHRLVDEASNLRGEKYVAHTAKDLVPYGLEKPYLRLRLIPSAKDAKEPAKERGLLVGKPTEKDAKSRFAKLEDSPAIFVLGEKVLAAVDRAALDLLDRDLLKLDTKDIQKIKTTGTAAPFTLQQQKETWQVVDSPAPTFEADEEAVQSSLRPWSHLKAQKHAAFGSKIDWKTFGLDKPVATVTATVTEPGEKDKPGKTSEHTVALGQEVKGSGERYARVDKQDAVVVLDAATVKELNRSHLDFVSRAVLKYDLDAVSTIQRQMGGADLEIVKKDDTWKIVKPTEQPADTQTMEGLLEKTFRLRAKSVAAYPAKDLKPFGLDNPVAVVTLKVDVQGKPTTHTLKIGKTVEDADKKDSADRYALVDKGDAVVVFGEDLAKQLVADPIYFRDRNLASFSDADKLELERGTRKLAFTKTDGTWKVTAPVKAEAEDDDVEDFLKGLLRLRADELVADKSAKGHGLERPLALWRIKSGDKEVLGLVVGGPEQGKEKDKNPRHYAKLTGSDLVFLLSAKQSARALGEFRSRKVWKAPDAAQVEKVTFGHAGNPFTLQKVDGNWQVAGKTDLKLNSKAVTDTLDALASLQAERYVADQAADLQLYGLQPPVLSVEVQTSSGKSVLHVGRPEGESKRHYATVPGMEGAPVFIINEADSQRIVRDMRAFTEEKKDAKEPTKK